MKIPLSWLREFVEVPGDLQTLISAMDDLGLVVEAVEQIGEGLDDVIVARIDLIAPIEGADRVRLVTVDAGDGPLDIVCGATNFAVGDHVPLAPVGAVLPGGFAIAERTMRGVTSHGMLCSARELRLSEDHDGLMILKASGVRIGQPLVEALGIAPDVVLDISIEGNRPDAWSILGVARDLATRFDVPLQMPPLAEPALAPLTESEAHASISALDLCGRLTVSVLHNVVVGPSPAHLARRLTLAGMRPISNVVDASNLVMLELGQPTHPYDFDKVARGTLGVRSARVGEVVTTLDGVERPLAQPGRGLGDAGEDCVIVDGNDHVIGLAGIMGGADTEISSATTKVMLEAAYFDPMTIARSSKRHGLRSEASNRFERGVDPELALLATARFVTLLQASSPNVTWLASPLDVRGVVPVPPTVLLRAGDIERTLGTALNGDEVRRILEGLDFTVRQDGENLEVTPATRRMDIRSAAAGRADVIEEIARLASYSRLPRRTPSWPQPGGLTAHQKYRRRLRTAMVDLGVNEVWTPTFVSDEQFDLQFPAIERVRITNPLSAEESVLRGSLLSGVVEAWARNAERGLGDVALGEIGMVFSHPAVSSTSRTTRGGVGGGVALTLPSERERMTVVLGRVGDSAVTAVAFWQALAHRLGITTSVVRSVPDPAPGLHPTRGGVIEGPLGEIVGAIGEVDPALFATITSVSTRRLGVVDIDVAALFELCDRVAGDPYVSVPSRFPSASIDLALVTPATVHASQVAMTIRQASSLVQSVELFDVYRDEHLPMGTRSLAFSVRLGCDDHTLSEVEVAQAHAAMVDATAKLGATLRG